MPASKDKLVIPLQLGQWLAGLLVLIGMTCFVMVPAFAAGLLGSWTRMAFPVGHTRQAIQLPDGRFAVPMPHLDRVQIYSNTLQFERGWQIPNFRGFILQLSAKNQLEVLSSDIDNQYRYLYSPEGGVLKKETWPPNTIQIPSEPENTVELNIPSPFWIFPLRGPGFAWSLSFAGFIFLAFCRSMMKKYGAKPPNISRIFGISGLIIFFLAWFGVTLNGVVVSLIHGHFFIALFPLFMTVAPAVVLFNLWRYRWRKKRIS